MSAGQWAALGSVAFVLSIAAGVVALAVELRRFRP